MKRLYVPLGILVLILVGTLYNAHFLKQVTNDLSDLLNRAEARATALDWSAARKLTTQAETLWNDHSLYFHIVLRHSDTDDVEVQFQEVQGFLQAEDQEDYSAANSRLIALIALLYEGEQFILENVL